ncbi:MAG: NYN domain-containing protein [Tissierellia bacterium]|nr:NYN domain-containing protein [Tissierellia bacterium]
MEEKRFAVLIDADNVSSKYIKYILDETANYGIATYKRIYGDWTKPNTAAWKDVLLENSVTPIQQYGYTTGKNATDSAMIIDAMDILYSGNVDGFCIVSSDSDFTKLSSRLRESGMTVVGMGEKKTPKPFIASCNQFKYLDVLVASEEKTMEMSRDSETMKNGKKNSIITKTSNENDDSEKGMTNLSVIKTAVKKMLNEVDGNNQSMNMGEIGNRLAKRYPDFDVRNYGDTKLSKFLKKMDFIQIESDKSGGTAMWVSLKDEENKEEEEDKPVVTKTKRHYKKRKTKMD